MTQWLLVLAMGGATFTIRLSMLILAPRHGLPAPARRALAFVAPAVLAAIIVPAVLYVGSRDAFDATPGNERLVAAAVAAGVAWATRNTWATIAGGMAALWLLQAAG
jgi:branched-subunit amino acid transport protein